MANQIEVNHVTVSAMRDMFQELNFITSQPAISKVQEARASALQAQIACLRGGMSAQELAEASTQSLRQSLGMSDYEFRRLPKLPNVVVDQWRDFVKNGKTELRDSLESTSQFGNVTGLTYSGTSGAQGGFFVPPSYDKRVFASLGSYDEVVLDAYSNVWESDKLSAATTPSWEDTSEQGSPAALAFNRSTILGESIQDSVVPTTAAKIAWGQCPVYKSGRLSVALELEQDTFAPTVQLLEKVIAQRHALAFGAQAVTNILNSLSGTVQKVTSNASTLVLGDFINVVAALPHIYRKNCILLMNDATAMFLVGILEANSRPLIEGLNMFLGKRIAICNSLNVGGTSASAGNAAVVLAVDPSYLLQRRVPKQTIVRRYVQSAAGVEYGLCQVNGFFAGDFQILNAGSAFPPVSYLSQHA
jgi:HK97 family phage major capsid protein